ncbi:exosortase/archaeosortase family protein [Ruficoccus amylovorans]|uniref:Exosortase/archaeosortase family protein n=1 Tax=Ruficoccus amylovorans TaxID=1804625 RepID=A0A842HD53_9BACT|nr:exosortase/archaeosortase family protein [Ruficoccus amylovorans]MBC2593988.1 exosortase/archaeosortase family protein [Ruficoccus amylovorans]
MFRTLLLLAAFAAVVGGPLVNLSHYWNHNPLYGFGWFALVLAGVLTVQRLDRLPRYRPDTNRLLAPLILLLLLLWVPLRTIQVGNPDWRVLDTLFLLSAIAVTLLLIDRLFGRGWARTLAFPLLFLLVALPWPVKVENAVTLHSLLSVGQTAQTLLGWFGYQVQASGYEIQTEFGISHLAEACSGIRSFHLALVGGLFLGAFLRLTLLRRVLLLILCAATAYLINVARVIALVSIMLHSHSQDTMTLWHDRIGWGSQLLFIGLMFAEAIFLSMFKWDRPRREVAGESGVIRQAMREAPRGHCFLLTAIILLAVGSHLAAEHWYRWHEQRASGMAYATGWKLVDQLPDPNIRERDIPLLVREQLAYEDARLYTWLDPNGALWQLMWLRFDGSTYSAFAHNIHQPETCLPSQNFSLVENCPPLVMEIDGERFSWQHQVYQRDNIVLQLFFNKTATGPLLVDGSERDWSALGRLRQAWQGYRISNAQVMHLSVFAPYSPEVAQTLAEGYLSRFIEEAVIPAQAHEDEPN